MVAIGFTVFKEKILSGEKTQTIRPYSEKRWLSILRNKKLQLYWKLRTKNTEFLKEVVAVELFKIMFLEDWDDLGHKVIIVKRTDNAFSAPREDFLFNRSERWRDMSVDEIKEMARRDGFDDEFQMFKWFENKYGKDIWGKELMVIRWR